MGYPNLYKKSVLLEIVNKKNPGEIIDAFTLTIPPDSIEIIQSQRVTRTKTFGGVFEDDYGLDTAKITISGTTGNQEVRASYIPGKGSVENYTGKDAIFALRDKIIRYKVGLETKKLENYELRYYDLSLVDSKLSSGNEVVVSSTIDSWIVSLDDFKISRNKDRPLWFNYSIELLGISPLGARRQEKQADKSEPIPEATPDPDNVFNVADELGKTPTKSKLTPDWLQGAVGSLRRTVNAVRNAFAWGQNKINEFDNVLKLVDDLTEQVQEYVDASANIITSSLGIYRRLFSIAKFPGALAKSVMENVVKVMRSVKDTIEFTASLKEILGDDYNQIALCADEAQRIASQIVSYGKRKNTNTDSVAIVGGTPLTVVGTSSHMVTAGDDLTSIASSEYGDPALAELLVLYNGLTDDELVPGTELTVPILVRSVQNQDNALYGWNIQDTLGIDIAIDRSSGDITIVESGDFALVEGKETIIQAINLRLNEVLGRRLRLTTYGLKLVVGGAQDNSVPTSYILANIIDTLKQDPRILSVYNIKLVGQGDALHVAFNIDTIGEAVSYQGVI